MADGAPLPDWKSRTLDYVALGFILLATEELWRHPQVWYSWLGAFAAGVICAWFGDVAPAIKMKLLGWWRAPKDLAAVRAEYASLKAQLAWTLQENSELQKRLNIPKELIALPAPKRGRLIKPQHHWCPVRCRIDSIGYRKLVGQFRGDMAEVRMKSRFSRRSIPTESVDKCRARHRVSVPS